MMAVITNVIKICVKCTLLVIFALTGGEMMRHTVKIIICFALLGFSIMMPAQTLPVFPKDGAVTTGNLTNGITYYLVTNPSMKGVADFALVGGVCHAGGIGFSAEHSPAVRRGRKNFKCTHNLRNVGIKPRNRRGGLRCADLLAAAVRNIDAAERLQIFEHLLALTVQADQLEPFHFYKCQIITPHLEDKSNAAEFSAAQKPGRREEVSF